MSVFAPAPPAPTEQELVKKELAQATNRLKDLQKEMILLQAAIDTLDRRLAAMR